MALLLGIGFMILSLIVQSIFRRKMKRYGSVALRSAMSGKEVAARMLRDHQISNVRVLCSPAKLSDHYNPSDRTINLSPEVYEGSSVASAAVAAHECGHAIQHATAYQLLQLRSALVPLQNISARLLQAVFMMMLFGAFILPGILPFQTALLVIIGAYGVFTAFAFVTLPVEFDASRRALKWVYKQGIVSREEHSMASDALQAAAMTYVVAAISALGMLLYYLSLFLGNRD